MKLKQLFSISLVFFLLQFSYLEVLWAKSDVSDKISSGLNPLTILAEVGGGSDATGGNLIEDKPLESWAKILKTDSDTELSFKLIHQILLEKLKNEAQFEWVQNDDSRLRTLWSFLEYIYHGKKWYFIPGPLPEVPSELVGSVVKTNQGALQTIDKVFIDLNLWKGMQYEARRDLLVHEGIMGLKVLQFASSATQCRAALFALNGSCNPNLNTSHNKIKLTEGDYNDVQSITVDIIKSITIRSQTWIDFMAHKFVFKFPYFDLYEEITSSKLQEYLTVSAISNNLPTLGFTEKKQNLSCHIRLDFINEHMLKIFFKESEESNQKIFTFEIPNKFKTYLRRDDNKKQYALLSFLQNTEKPGPNGGFLQNNVVFYLYNNMFEILLSENICIKKDCSSPNDPTSLSGGFSYFCTNPELLK